mgnify:CR=1 FL=1
MNGRPKFPIYRIKYVYCVFEENSNYPEQKYAERIVELKPEYVDEEYGAADFKVKENVIHQSVIDKLKNNKPYCDETMCVISVERLA